MNLSPAFYKVLLLVTLSAISPTVSPGAEMPENVQLLVERRKEAIAKIDKTFIQELEKLKSGYTKSGDLDKAIIVAKLIESTPSAVVSMEGKWRYKPDGKPTSLVRVFKGNKMIDEHDKELSWAFEGDGITIDYGGGAFEKLIIDPQNPDVMQGVNYSGMKFTYTRIK